MCLSEWLRYFDAFDVFIISFLGVHVQIAQNMPSKQFPNKDTEVLATHPRIDVRSVDMKSLVGAGIVHTKVWIVDEMHMYVGSANFDWRSLTEVNLRMCSHDAY